MEAVRPPSRSLVHVPTPGDHYSPATGSATMTVVYEMTRCHEREGGRSRIVVGRGTRHDYDVGECVEVDFPPALQRRARIVEGGLARLGLPRVRSQRVYAPVHRALGDLEPRDTVLFHNAAAAAPYFRGRGTGAQIGLYCHNELFNTYDRRETRRAVAAADRVVCVSRYIADYVAARGGPEDRLRVVHNGVDTERFAPVAREPNDPPVVLFVGRVQPYKGAHLLIEAAGRIYGRGRRFKVRIVGSSGFSRNLSLSPYEEELRRLARPIADAVEFQPFVDRAAVAREYQHADVFCTPSEWDDPCPLTLLEGMSSGLATVATRRGGIPEVGGDAILYFDPPDVGELAELLAFLLDDEGARSERARAARARAETLTWESQYAQLMAALET